MGRGFLQEVGLSGQQGWALRWQAASCLCSGIWSGCPGKGVGWPAWASGGLPASGRLRRPWLSHSSSSAGWVTGAGRGSEPALLLTFPLWGMWDPLPSRCRQSSRSQEPGPGWEGMQGSGLGTLPRSLHGSLPGTLSPETAISASLQVGPARLRGWCQRCCVPSPSV